MLRVGPGGPGIGLVSGPEDGGSPAENHGTSFTAAVAINSYKVQCAENVHTLPSKIIGHTKLLILRFTDPPTRFFFWKNRKKKIIITQSCEHTHGTATWPWISSGVHVPRVIDHAGDDCNGKSGSNLA